MVRDGEVIAHDGTRVKLRANTICMHGDGPTAPQIGAELRQRLEAAGVQIAPLASLLG